MTYYFKHILISVVVILSVFLYSASVCTDPVKNVRFYRVSNDSIVIYYDLESTEPVPVSVVVSLDGGESFPLASTPAFVGIFGIPLRWQSYFHPVIIRNACEL